METNREELKMTYSCMLSKGKERIVKVNFECGSTYAEGLVPGGKIENQQGFTEDEIRQLEKYLMENETLILEKAKEISGIKHWF